MRLTPHRSIRIPMGRSLPRGGPPPRNRGDFRVARNAGNPGRAQAGFAATQTEIPSGRPSRPAGTSSRPMHHGTYRTPKSRSTQSWKLPSALRRQGRPPRRSACQKLAAASATHTTARPSWLRATMTRANATQHHAKSHAVRGVMRDVYPPVTIRQSLLSLAVTGS